MRALIWRDALVMTSIKTAPEARKARVYGYRPDGVELRCPPLELVRDPGSEFWARQHAADILRAWGLEYLGSLVDPLVTEMVANGIRHTLTHIAVILRTSGPHLVIEVWDANIRPSSTSDSTGQAHDGLTLTKTLADRWEIVNANQGGRLVRARLALDAKTDVLAVARQLTAGDHHSASLRVREPKPTPEMITRVIAGIRALADTTLIPAQHIPLTPAAEGPRRAERGGH
jgi:hypothetical protein